MLQLQLLGEHQPHKVHRRLKKKRNHANVAVLEVGCGELVGILTPAAQRPQVLAKSLICSTVDSVGERGTFYVMSTSLTFVALRRWTLPRLLQALSDRESTLER